MQHSLVRFLAAVAVLVMLAPAHAFEPFVVKDIRVEGLQRTDPGTVFSYLPVKVGERMTEDMATRAIRALYDTGFFRDVSLEMDKGVLIVTVVERPSIAQIDFVGTKEFDKAQLLKALRDLGLSEGRIFDRSLLERAEQELKRQYVSRGYYAANVTTTVTPLERNRVGISFDVTEGGVAKIRQITLVGNKAFPEKQLLEQFRLRPPGIFTWYTKDDQYSRQKLQGDLEALRSYYQNRGYAEFTVDSTQVSITPDKKDVYITIGMTEGPRFTVSSVRLAGDMIVPEPELEKMLRIKAGDVFSREKVTESTKLITDRLGNDGYAFANVNVAPELDKQKNTIALTLYVDPGRRVYVRRINITGNTRTRDEVIRREMRQTEGGYYSTNAVQLSRQRVDKTGYFQEVAVETPAVPGTTDQVDVNFSVVEKPTGNLAFGAGFSSGEGILLNASVSQANIFGSGNTLGFGINTSQLNTTYSLSFTNPYFTVDGVSRGFDVYYRKLDPSQVNLGQYKTTSYGGMLRFGIPITEIDTISMGIGYDNTEIELLPLAPLRYVRYVATFGPENSTVMGNVGWSRDTRDSAIYPTRGATQRAIADLGLPGGDLTYYKLEYEQRRFFPISQSFTWMVFGAIGYGDGYSNTPELPFFRNFYTGGPTSVRGFYPFTVGPKDIEGNPTGGPRKMLASTEILFPVPGLGLQDKTARLGVFLDTGMVGNSYDFGDVRMSTGLSAYWVSPFGPLSISVAAPFRSKELDRKQSFQFQFGRVF